jgi:16S rRNA (guanine966-N2)-methyltransferase
VPELRVTGGGLRGRRVPVPPGEIRPTSERARQAFFNIVAAELPGANFLDLFAGTGIFSFEAISRGAATAVAVEQAPRAAASIVTTAARLQAEVELMRADVFIAIRRLEESGRTFGIVYADPPYAFAEYPRLLAELGTGRLLAPRAVVAVEHRKGSASAPAADTGSLRYRKTAQYGDISIALYDLS